MPLDAIADLLTAIATLAWPIIFAAVMFKFAGPIRTVIESARGRRFTVKVAGNELTVEEASEQQRHLVNDVQSRVAELERRLCAGPSAEAPLPEPGVLKPRKLLWVDNRPKNNSFLIANIEEQGHSVDIALDTDQALAMFRRERYDAVISDMARPGDDKAGITLAKEVRALGSQTPFFIFCSGWAARHLQEEAREAGVQVMTSSSTHLLSVLPI